MKHHAAIGRLAAPLLALLTLAAVAPALAAPIIVSAPTGAIQGKQTPISVHWAPMVSGTTINIELDKVVSGGWFPVAQLATGAPDVGHATVSIPDQIHCGDANTYKIEVQRPQGNVTEWGDSALFHLICDGGDRRVTVTKRMINPMGYPVPTNVFQVKVDCTPGGPDVTVTLSPSAGMSKTVFAPDASQCTVQELRPTSNGCQWNVSYPNGQTVQPTGVVEVDNTLQCSQGGGGTVNGSFTIAKSIVNTTGVPTPNPSFQVHVDCNHGGPQTTVTLTAPGALQQIISSPLGSTCTIAELPPSAPGGCQWTTSYPDGQGISIGERSTSGSTRRIVNTLSCAGGHEDLPVTIEKKIINKTGVQIPPGLQFHARVDCIPFGPHAVVTLTTPSSLHAVLGARRGSRCTVQEIPPDALGPCWWTTTYPQGQSVQPGSSLEIDNELHCRGVLAPNGQGGEGVKGRSPAGPLPRAAAAPTGKGGVGARYP